MQKCQGGLIRASEGRVSEHTAVNCTAGTRVQVDELFGNLPARRKFLKSTAGELRRAAADCNKRCDQLFSPRL